MARVNLEQRFFAEGRLHELADYIGCTTHEAIGLLAYLWHDSQELGVSKATSRKILVWCRWKEIQWNRLNATSIAPSNAQLKWSDEILLIGLVESGYIKKIEDDLYEIRGNEPQLDGLKKAKEKAQKASRARWDKDEKPSDDNIPSDAPSNAQASSDAMPFNTIQGNAIQNNKKTFFDFEAAYAEYPKKVGKVDGLEECKKQIRTPEDYQALRQAVKNYAAFMTRPLQPGEFRPEPKHFDTWMRKGRWRECLDPDFGNSASSESTKPSGPDRIASTTQLLAEYDRWGEEAKRVDPNKIKAMLRSISGKSDEL